MEGEVEVEVEGEVEVEARGGGGGADSRTGAYRQASGEDGLPRVRAGAGTKGSGRCCESACPRLKMST